MTSMNSFLSIAHKSRLLTVLLIAAMLLSFFSGIRFNSYSSVTTVTSCPQAKAAQTHAERNCQFTASLTGIIEQAATFIISFTGKLLFLFVAALTLADFKDRLFKPPRSLASI